jgi:hypothetical protein
MNIDPGIYRQICFQPPFCPNEDCEKHQNSDSEEGKVELLIGTSQGTLVVQSIGPGKVEEYVSMGADVTSGVSKWNQNQ